MDSSMGTVAANSVLLIWTSTMISKENEVSIKTYEKHRKEQIGITVSGETC